MRSAVQAAFFDGVSFDPFTFKQDYLASPEVDVGRGEIFEALVVSAIIVMLDEGCDLGFEVLLEEVIFEQDAVLERLAPTFDFPLRLRMPMDLLDLVFLQPFTKVGSDINEPLSDSRRGRCSTLTRVTA